jgi:uncharacterized protein (DUF3820 family)
MENLIISFGKYKGQKYIDLPTNYINWLLENCCDKLPKGFSLILTISNLKKIIEMTESELQQEILIREQKINSLSLRSANTGVHHSIKRAIAGIYVFAKEYKSLHLIVNTSNHYLDRFYS